MALSVFEDRSRRPTPAELDQVLGPAAPLWRQLVEQTAALAAITEHWNYSGAKFGWSLRLKRGQRIMLYMTPQARGFLVGVVLGEQAAATARQRRFSARVLELIESAPRYSEGRGIRMSVANRADLLAALRLAELKVGP